ncbi:ATP-dependent protease La, putative [Babesia ovata]|uniref:ATP-dependent protease La, putative n=1 Tax=Babesia ovata TaxID=189622 RepID=A0A2H6KB98_9APIC|nr:ATP-dependent protease La, putative [Babesia ovata]GBE60270.1 ATP-dependent protease La, putative [Babesia ovata]
MSLQFLREFNKNVKESLSILNEGFEITNGVAELSNVHLPYIQLFKRPEGLDGTPICCIFGPVGYVRTSVDQHVSEASSVSRVAQPTSAAATASDVKEAPSASSTETASNAGGDDAGEPSSLQVEVEQSRCALGDGCILKRVDAARFQNSITSVIEILKSVENVLSSTSVATRRLLENQVIPALCNLLEVSEVARLFHRPNPLLSKKFGNTETVHVELLGIVSIVLRLMDQILVYPESLTKLKGRNVFEADISPSLQCNSTDVMARVVAKLAGDIGAVDTGSKNFDHYDCPCEYEYFGKVAIVSITDAERDALKHLLALLNTVTIASQFGRNILTAAEMCIDGHGMLERDVVTYSLSIVEKLYTHNDFAWHLHQADDKYLYTLDILDACYVNWQLAYKGVCFSCEHPLGIVEIPESIPSSPHGTICNCVISRSDHAAPNRHLIEKELVDSEVNPSRLMRLAKESGDMTLRTRVTGILLQWMLNSASFQDHFVAEGCISLLLEVLNGCYVDQFGLLNDSLAEIPAELSKKQAAALESELAIGMSFVPCSIECILMLRHCLKLGRLGDTHIRPIIKFVTQLASTLLKTWIFYYCTKRGCARDGESSILRQILCIVMDVCCALVRPRMVDMGTTLSQTPQNAGNPNHALSAVRHLRDCARSTHVQHFAELIDTGIAEEVMYALYVLCNRTRFGYEAPEHVVDQLMRFISTLEIASRSNTEVADLLMSRMQMPAGDRMPAVYAHVIDDIQTRDVENLKLTPIVSQIQARLSRFRMEIFGEIAETPVLVLLLLCLFDSDVAASFKAPLWGCALRLVIASTIFEKNEMAADIFDYVRDLYRDSFTILDNSTDTTDKQSYLRHLASMLDMSLILVDCGVDDASRGKLLGDDPWNVGMAVLAVSIKLLKLQKTDYNITLTVKALSYLASYLSMRRHCAEPEDVDSSPIIECMTLYKEDTQCATITQLAALVLSLLKARGVTLLDDKATLQTIVTMSESLIELHRNKQQIQALRLMTGLQPCRRIDCILQPYEDMLEVFLSETNSICESDALGVVVWNRTGLCELELSPRVHYLIERFRWTLHIHVIGRMVDTLRDYTLIHVDDAKRISSKTAEEVQRMSYIHAEEIAFAQERISKLNKQVEVMAKSFYKAEEVAAGYKKELEEMRKENKRLRKRLKNSGHPKAAD